MTTKKQAVVNRFSAWNMARSDEPIFVLRALDPLASNALRTYAHEYRIMYGLDRPERAERYKQILALADSMVAYQDDDIPL